MLLLALYAISHTHSHPQLPFTPCQVKKKPEAGSEEASSKVPAKAPAAATGGGGGGVKGKAKGKGAVGKFDEPPDVPEPNISVSQESVLPLCVCGGR